MKTKQEILKMSKKELENKTMAYQKPQIKTDAEWKEINFKNSLGPQIGGLIHDAVALAIARFNKVDLSKYSKKEIIKETEEEIKYWLDNLYEIAEQKKSQILKDQEPKPLTSKDIDNAEKMGAKVLENENQEEKEGLDNANYQANEVSRNSGGTIPF